MQRKRQESNQREEHSKNTIIKHQHYPNRAHSILRQQDEINPKTRCQALKLRLEKEQE
jgi:hypothetical protein